MASSAFLDRIIDIPAIVPKDGFEHWYDTLLSHAAGAENPEQFQTIIAHPKVKGLLGVIFSASPFLSKIITTQPIFFTHICWSGPEECFAELIHTLTAYRDTASAADLMKAMRIAKGKASLLIALADITGIWLLEKVTGSMSEFAEVCTELVLGFLLRQAAEKKDIVLKHPANPQQESGIFVLAMGKLGAHELNYSSDIDLVVFFDKEKMRYTGAHDAGHWLAKAVHEMVRMLQERTADGYVFRVDLRLRPDPASTPAAISIVGAMTYYETVGQNWERAAFIKARSIAGDKEAGQAFLEQMIPFIWRKHLDFAAINDIQSIKRQMDERMGKGIILPGHNIKTGIGGIREIEFFAQIHQLIWGGRMMHLRVRETCETLQALAEEELIDVTLSKRLIVSYRYLRKVEHRLQMVDDQQTHMIPETKEAREAFARFMGYAGLDAFEKELLAHLEFVHENFAGAFRGQYSLSGDEGKLSFTGVENDPQTVETIARMGYRNPAAVSEVIQGWHRGHARATRTKRARELITELTPVLLKAFASTTDPNQAFMHFDLFLTKLPAGVQLFSLFNANPQLLNLIAIIMGSAPAMAETLSKNPHLLDVVLTGNFYQDFADKQKLCSELSDILLAARGFEDEIDSIRRFKNEKQFQVGVQLITHRTDPLVASRCLSNIADICIEAILQKVEVNFAARQPELRTNRLAVIVLGRLGAQELTFGSDIDMVFVYDTDEQNALLPPSHSLYNKLSQRFISAVTSLTKQGRLYEVDTRLRPSGGDGLLAVSTGAFEKYFQEAAWTFELMAFTRARVITGSEDLKKRVEDIIGQNIMRRHSAETLSQDIFSLRAKITREFGSDNPWNLKYVHGGLMDLDFLAQYFVLLHAHTHPAIIASSSGEVFCNLVRHKLMDAGQGETLAEAHGFFGSLFTLLRLCGGSVLDEKTAPDGLKHIIAKILQLPDFERVRTKLLTTVATVSQHFNKVVSNS